MSPQVPQTWDIVGGADKGGILVREGQGLATPQLPTRLSTGSLVEEVELKGERLRYSLLEGSGPASGWISVRMMTKQLAVRRDGPSSVPPEPAVPEQGAPGGHGAGPEPLPIALLFPGQGSQYVGMLKEVKDIPSVKAMLQKSNEVLGWDLLEICLTGPEQKLEETRFCQPAMFVGGLAGVEKLRSQKAEAVNRCSVMAGLSLGEYTALCAAGVMSFEDGLQLVKLRGEAMQEAATAGKKQLMLSVANLDAAKLTSMCEDAKRKEGSGAVCQIANHLFPGGFSVGGTEAAIRELESLAGEAGAIAKVLKTGGAFHTPLMQPAQDRLSAAIDDILPRMTPPRHTVWMNASAEPVRPGCDVKTIAALMKRQLTNPVYWEQSVRAMIQSEGVSEFYECGPKKQIKAMMKRIDAGAWKNMTNVEA